jgi:adenosylhomocysteine nucleosidase
MIMRPIGLLAAMPQESDALLRCVHAAKRIAVGAFSGKSFELSGQTCLLVTSGMGVRRAGEAARALVEHSVPRLLISFGIAGAVEADLHIGDVIMAAAVCRLEQGLPGALAPLAAWPAAAHEAAAGALSGRGARLFSGTAITTAGSQVTQTQLGQMPHPILEMETAAIAQVAAENGRACLSIRAISDGPAAPIPFDLGQMMDADANLQAGKLFQAILRRPAILFQSGRMLRNSRIAADNAAIALTAALGQI